MLRVLPFVGLSLAVVEVSLMSIVLGVASILNFHCGDKQISSASPQNDNLKLVFL